MYISALLGLFEAWQGQFAWHRHIDVWRLVPHCLMWCIWCERNARSFKDCERSLLEIKSFFLHTLFEWSVVFSHFSCSSFPIFLVLLFLFFLIVVLLSLDLCPHSTSPMYSAWHFFFFFNNILTLLIKKKKIYG